MSRSAGGLTLARQLDDTRYTVRVVSDRELDIADPGGALVPAHGARVHAAHLVSGVFRVSAAGADAECGSGA